MKKKAGEQKDLGSTGRPIAIEWLDGEVKMWAYGKVRLPAKKEEKEEEGTRKKKNALDEKGSGNAIEVGEQQGEASSQQSEEKGNGGWKVVLEAVSKVDPQDFPDDVEEESDAKPLESEEERIRKWAKAKAIQIFGPPEKKNRKNKEKRTGGQKVQARYRTVL